MKRKFLVFDLDGTSLGGKGQPYYQFRPEFAKFLDRISLDGHVWAINSMWRIHEQWGLILNSPLRSRPACLIGELGLSLAYIKNGYPTVDGDFASKIDQQTKRFAKSAYRIIHQILARYSTEIRSTYFVGRIFHMTFHPRKIEHLTRYVRDNFAHIPDVTVHCGEDGGLVIHPCASDKGQALEYAMKKLNFKASETVTAGDHKIDLSMLSPRLAQYLVCPSNSIASVKKHVKTHGGIVAKKPYALGIQQAFDSLS